MITILNFHAVIKAQEEKFKTEVIGLKQVKILVSVVRKVNSAIHRVLSNFLKMFNNL